MPRIVYLGLFLLVAAIPFMFFGALSGSSGSGSQHGSGHHYRSGPSFFFMHFGGSGRGWGGSSSRGRNFGSSGYRGGGSRSGK
jgi:hypothetical protein